MVFVEGLIILATVLYLLYKYGTETYDHWNKKGVKHMKPLVPFVGNSENMVYKKETILETLNRIYMSFPKERFAGFFIFRQPALLIRDPELIKQVMIKDADVFVNRYTINVFISPEADSLLEKSLVSIKDEQWRTMRNALSPAFTSSKLKNMLDLINNYGKQMTQHLDEMSKRQVEQNHPDGDMLSFEFKAFFRRFTNDVIATCAFGVDVDSFKVPDNEFYKTGVKAQDYNFIINYKLVLFMIIPSIMKMLNISLFDKHLHTFFKNLVRDSMDIRKEQNIVRPDLLHLLMQAKNKSPGTDQTTVTDENISAEALLFFFAAFEVSAITLSFTAHELAVNPDVQKRLQEEIDQVIEEDNGVLTYEGLMQKMKYLDMVVNESLRKWPPGPVSDRIVNKPYLIPKTETSPEVLLDKNDVIWVPLAAIHRNPEYFPNPDKFDPERFSDENKDKIPPYTYLPFGIGPRHCISQRFGLLEVKACIVHLLQKYSFTIIPQTQHPIQLTKGLFSMTPEKGFWLGLKPRSDK